MNVKPMLLALEEGFPDKERAELQREKLGLEKTGKSLTVSAKA